MIRTVILALILSTSAVTAQKGVYASLAECEAGTDNYTPSFLAGHRPLEAGQFLAPLGQRQCGKLLIAGGQMAIVGQAPTDEMVWVGNPINPGAAVVNRRWDCGNKAEGFRLIPNPTQIVGPPLVGPPVEMKVGVNVHHTFDTLHMKVSGEVNPPEKRAGFWCFRGFGQGLACVLGVTALTLGIVELIDDDDDKKEGGVPAGGHTGPAFNLAPIARALFRGG